MKKMTTQMTVMPTVTNAEKIWMMMLSSRFMKPREMNPSKPPADCVKGVEREEVLVASTNWKCGYHSRAPLQPKDTNIKSMVWAQTMMELTLRAVREKLRSPEVAQKTQGWLGK